LWLVWIAALSSGLTIAKDKKFMANVTEQALEARTRRAARRIGLQARKSRARYSIHHIELIAIIADAISRGLTRRFA